MNDAKIKEGIELLKRYKFIEKEVCDSILDSVNNIPELDGVTTSSESLICCTVKMSTLMNSSFNLTAEYYLAESQRKAVSAVLEKCNGNISAMTKHIKEMLDSKCAVVSSNYKVRLNASSINALQKIYEKVKDLESV